MDRAVQLVVDLVDPESQQLWGRSLGDARRALLAEDQDGVLSLGGSFALVAQEGELVRLARSLDRPLRYFLAKQADGPLLVVAERIDAIRRYLDEAGMAEQFHPSYTRMVPAHHITTLRLVGCPDPAPTYRRFFSPPREMLPADLDVIGERYVAALSHELGLWLDAVPQREPLGTLFSGGLDSGSVLLCLYRLLLERGESPSRLKAFTLAVGGGGEDSAQARQFLRRVGLEMLGEEIEVSEGRLDPLEAVALIEDYKPLDVECAAMQIALLEALRERYPAWRYLVDGDGGDENFKDYPVEENPELTIRSVVNNPLLYQEGWGVDCIKHSLTYSGGYSRACVRTAAPLRRYGFVGFSPHTRPSTLAVATAIPFDRLAEGSLDRLYSLKGEILARGLRRVWNLELPVFGKRRFQHGAAPPGVFESRFGRDPEVYRRHFQKLHSTSP